MRKSEFICFYLLVILLFFSQAYHGRAIYKVSYSNHPMTSYEKKIVAELSVDECYRHMTFLVEEVGERLAGTKSIEKAAGYIKKELDMYGLDVRIDRFPMYHSYPVLAELKVVFPEKRDIEARPVCHILSTPEKGITGELVYAGAGGYEDYENIEARGKVVLTDMTWSPPRPEKARIAYEKKAKALIIMNWGTSDNPVIQMGAVKSVWGNPTPESFKKIPQIPVISITRASGEYLRDICSEGKVNVWLYAEATREWVLANQPVGILRCQEDTEDFVLIGGHLEAWGKTAICNSSGNSLMLELARIFARYRNKLKRNIVFAFWDGHEIAEAAGSAYYVDRNWDELSRYCLAYINIDNPGIKGTRVPKSRGVPEIKDFQMQVVKEYWGKEGDWNPAYKGGDESFLGVGVPYIGFATGYAPEELKRLNYASLSPWLHSEADTIDKIDKNLFEKHLHFFAGLIWRLCNSKIAPYNLIKTAESLKKHLQSLKDLSKDIKSVDVVELISKAEQLEKVLQEFKRINEERLSNTVDEKENTIEIINQALIKVSRELSPILWTEAGRYGQDPYGYHLVGKSLPRLYKPLKQMQGLKENQEEFTLWWTKFIRERNRISDAINNSLTYLTLTTQLLEEFD